MKINEVLNEAGIGGFLKGAGKVASTIGKAALQGVGDVVAPNTTAALYARQAAAQSSDAESIKNGRDLLAKAHEMHKNWETEYKNRGEQLPKDPETFINSLNQFINIPQGIPRAFNMVGPPPGFAQAGPDVHGNYLVPLTLKSLNPNDVDKYIASTMLYQQQLRAQAEVGKMQPELAKPPTEKQNIQNLLSKGYHQVSDDRYAKFEKKILTLTTADGELFDQFKLVGKAGRAGQPEQRYWADYKSDNPITSERVIRDLWRAFYYATDQDTYVPEVPVPDLNTLSADELIQLRQAIQSSMARGA